MRRACPLERSLQLGADWWPLKMARELDDAILNLRTNELELGLWIIENDRRRQCRPSRIEILFCNTTKTGSSAKFLACCGEHSRDSTSLRARCMR